MDDSSNRRRYPRANVDEDHTVRFHLGDKAYTGLVMTNLSAGGCCIKVPAEEAEGMAKGTLVHTMYLVHPRIPSTPLQASISWLLGRQPGRNEGVVLVGLEFVDLNPYFQATLERYVQEILR